LVALAFGGVVAKIRSRRGFRFVKELGGAVRHQAVSKTARVLVERGLVVGRVLDYGCGHGFDADALGWEAFDPYYRRVPPRGPFDTVVCNHVANMLTRASRRKLFADLAALLAPGGRAYFSVSRKVPVAGKVALRKRIQNYVVLTLSSVYRDGELEVYRLEAGCPFDDLTQDIEDRL
jgi:SAM-dependent methyltransferase